MAEGILWSADVAFATRLHTWPSSTTEYLQNVQDWKVNKFSLRTVVHLSSFDNHLWKVKI